MLTRRSSIAGAAASLALGSATAGDDVVVVRGRQLTFRGLRVRCAVGRSGISWEKREGDGATPAGRFPLLELFYRPDRVSPPATMLPIRRLSPADGWCDAPTDVRYNHLVGLPYAGHHEELWRADRLYDLLVVTGFNTLPVVPGRGSAVFLHVASSGFGATDGCVAIERNALRQVLEACGPGTMIDIATAA